MPKYHYDTLICKVEKLKPTYLLNDVKKLVQEKRCKLTRHAEQSTHSLNFSATEAKEFILSLEPKDFIKSMTDNYNHKKWQDVYIKKHDEINLYIKLKITAQNLLILSFKQDTSE